MEDKMEITRNIIQEEISRMKEKYDELGKLFEEKNIPKPEPMEGTIEKLIKDDIIKGTEIKDIIKNLKKEKLIENLNLKGTTKNLEKIRKHLKYKEIASNNPKLIKYYGETIYMFFVEKFPYDLDEITKIFKVNTPKSDNGKKFSLCRINEKSKQWKNVKTNNNICLYVGSSKDIQKRLKEHLLNCSPDTYAMHLKTWFPKDVSIKIRIWGFCDFLEGKDDFDYLQNIEDLLWNSYEPLFGRQGKK